MPALAPPPGVMYCVSTVTVTVLDLQALDFPVQRLDGRRAQPGLLHQLVQDGDLVLYRHVRIASWVIMPCRADIIVLLMSPLVLCRAVSNLWVAVVMPLMLIAPAVMALSTAESMVEARLAATPQVGHVLGRRLDGRVQGLLVRSSCSRPTGTGWRSCWSPAARPAGRERQLRDGRGGILRVGQQLGHDALDRLGVLGVRDAARRRGGAQVVQDLLGLADGGVEVGPHLGGAAPKVFRDSATCLTDRSRPVLPWLNAEILEVATSVTLPIVIRSEYSEATDGSPRSCRR